MSVYIPHELDRLRIEQNLTLRELARRSDISAPTVTGVLGGRANLSSTIRVCNALGYSLSWTFWDDESCKRRLLLLPGSLQRQLSVFRQRYTNASIPSLRAPRLSVNAIRDLERGNDCRFETIDRLGRLLNLEFALVRGTVNNVMDRIPSLEKEPEPWSLQRHLEGKKQNATSIGTT